ncbi:MAG: hypothetical protein LBT24_04820 [Tannerella sp.]|jgi:hypothetical protein|nr:hypothetical protein [Tannerella sp.]
MKQWIKLFFGISTLLLINACRTIYPSSEVNYLLGDEQTVTVRAVGLGNNEEKAVINAEQKVFDVLFFRGLPESKQKLPMIGSNETKEKSTHKKYFDEFYDGRRHKTFVMSSIPVSNAVNVKDGQKQITVDVKVNLSALRRDLETFGVIRKFGY